MAYAAEASQPKVIVVPRPLEGFFFERLSRHYADRSDIKVVVDRRVGERRRVDRYVAGPGPLSERRRTDRRADRVSWSLPDLPFSFS